MSNVQPKYRVETYEGPEGGYMVHLNKRTSFHVANDERLVELGFDKPAPLIDEEGDIVPAKGSRK